MNTAETKIAESIARELIRIGEGDPIERADRLDAAARAIRAYVESGDVAEEDARGNLLAAAVRAGLDGKDAADVIEWAWFGDRAPELRLLYPAAFPPPEPVDREEAAAGPDDLDRTGEHPTGIVAAAAGLDRLVEHARGSDERRSGPPCGRWELAIGTLSLVPDHLTALVEDVGRRLPDDHLADGVAILVMLAAQLAADLGLDLGAALVRHAATEAATPA